ncbi:MAG: amidohydrolase family protein [Nanoarchaeota archaeon]|nr:amidohydrolase family protein [Nanoarchaeota archaeon]
MKKWSEYFVDNENIALYEQVFKDLHIIDCHTHLGNDIDGHKQSIARLIREMDRLGIEKSISFPLNTGGEYHNANNLVLNAHKKYTDRIIPFFRLNPHTNWKSEAKLRVEQGFKGVKLHPRSQHFKISTASKIFGMAEDNDLMVMVHTGLGVPSLVDDLKKMAKLYPKLRMMLGHSAFIDLNEGIRELGRFKNVRFEISTIKIFDLFALLKKIPPEKILFGSDTPYYDPQLSIEMLLDTALMVGKKPQEIKKILEFNARGWLE